MRALIVGLGSIGRRHLANLRHIAPDAEVTIWRQHTAAGGDTPADASNIVYSREAALATKPEIAIIASPASLHTETAVALAENGVHVMVEKPLADRLYGTEALLRLCEEKRLVLLVAYHLRFSESLRQVRELIAADAIGRVMSIRAEVGQYLAEWRPGSDYRDGVSAQRKLGGGAILELSHEIDYARWLLGEVSEVFAMTGQLSDLELEVEDTAEILLRFQNRAIGSIHLDMTQRSRTRTCKIIGTDGTLTWDGLTSEVRKFSGENWHTVRPPQEVVTNRMYVAELQHFLNCVAGEERPLVNGAEGRRVLEIALAAAESARTGRKVEI